MLTQSGQDLGRTRLHWLDTATGATSPRAELAGQATSAVPVGDRVVVVAGAGLVRIDPAGRRSTFAATGGPAFRVHPDSAGGVVYVEQHGGTSVVRRAAAGRVTELARGPLTELARGPLTEVGLSAGTGGRVFLTGRPSQVGTLPPGVSRVDVPARAELSTHGQLAVTHATARAGDRIPADLVPARGEASPVALRATVLPTGQAVQFRLTPRVRPDRTAAPSGTPGPRAPAGAVFTQASADEPYDTDRTCAVPRNDPEVKAYQPHWNQVEWAADRAVLGQLDIVRPANWKGSRLPAWSPQGMFPSIPLDGGGHVPVAVLLGVLTQESNLWQASRHAVEGVTGNPLVGNFYGQGGGDPWAINWPEADCGYGIGQVTDGMRRADTQRTATQKQAIALDYATNIAAALRILQQKWNQTRRAGIVIHDGDPRWPENWWAAVWAYNTGMNPGPSTGNTSGCEPGPSCTDSGGNWGLGYTNNPANISYPRDRQPFLVADPDDARNPQRWSYPEKVLGWVAFPIIKVELSDPDEWHAGFAAARWSTEAARYNAIKPPLNLFCNASDHCDINRFGEACTLANFHCWWHSPASWQNCASECGQLSVSYSGADPEPAGRENGNYPPECDLDGLPGNAIIVDDTTAQPVRGCNRPNLSGTLSWRFAVDATGRYRSKIDFHQIGAGWGDHFWFSHTYVNSNALQEVRGTWTPNLPRVGWYRVLAHLPDHGAHTRNARYDVRHTSAASGSARART